MPDVSKKDWKLFREKLPEWQEHYMEKLIIKYVRMLSSPGNASDHFWDLEKRINRDKKHPGVMMKLSKAEMPWDIALLIKKKVIKLEDLEGFSQELIEMVQRLLDINN
jgi:hypothetical protein